MMQSSFSGFAHILCSVIIGSVLFYMLDPLVTLMEKRQGVRRGAAIGVIFTILLAVIVGVFVLVIPLVKYDVANFAGKLPELEDRVNEVSKTLLDAMFGTGNNSVLRNHFADLIDSTKAGVISSIKGILGNAAAIYRNVAAVVIDIVTGIIFAYYFIKDKDLIAGWLLGLFPYKRQNDVLKVTREIGSIVSSFISGQLTVAIIVGVIETIGLALIGIPVPWLFGIIGGVSNLMPYIGPIIGAVPSTFAALLISPWRGIFTVLLFVLVQQLDNNFISPKIIEGRLGVHPVVSIIVIFAGGELWGLAGVLLGIPLYAIIRCVVRYFVRSIAEARVL